MARVVSPWLVRLGEGDEWWSARVGQALLGVNRFMLCAFEVARLINVPAEAKAIRLVKVARPGKNAVDVTIARGKDAEYARYCFDGRAITTLTLFQEWIKKNAVKHIAVEWK